MRHHSMPTLAWIICLLGTLFYLFTTLIGKIPFSMINQLAYSFQTHIQSIQILSSVYIIPYLIAQIPAGIVLDQYGTRRTLTVAALLVCIGLTIFASTQSFSIAVLSRFLISLGASFGLIGALFLITKWTPKQKRAFYFGVALAIGLSGALFQASLTYIINRYGWRSFILLFSIIGAGFSLLMWMLAKTPHSPERHAAKWWNLTESYKAVLNKPQNWALALYAGLMFLPTATISFGWGILFLKAHYPDLTLISLSNINELILLGWILGCPLAGWFSDRWQQRRALALCGAMILFIALLLLTYTPTLPVDAAFVLFFIMGLSSSLSSLVFVMSTETNLSHHTGTAIGFISLFFSLPAFILSGIIEYLLNQNWTGRWFAGTRIYEFSAFQKAMMIEYTLIFIAVLIAFFFLKESSRSS